MIETDLSHISLLVAPATPQEFNQVMSKLASFIKTFGGSPAELKEAADFYRLTLDDIPAPLLIQAIIETMRKWKYQSLPKPADIRAHIVDDLARANLAKMRLEMIKHRMDK